MTTRDKVRGMLLGIGIGDAIGRPVEGWTHEDVRSTYGRITKYIFPDGWRAGRKAWTTDDTALSIASAEGLLLAGGKPDMDTQVKAHINAFNESTQGWGSTTYEAVRRLANGTPWTLAGARGGRLTGVGNGCILKLAPVSLLLVQNVPGSIDFIQDLISMTHQTSVAASAGLAYTNGLAYCLQTDAASFDADKFVEIVVDASLIGRDYFPDTLNEDDITERLALCRGYADWPPQRCVEAFENGRNYVYDAMPYSLMYFLRQPTSVDALYEVVSCGGDADSVTAIIGSLVGGLNGTAVFPVHLVDELVPADRLVRAANRLCDLFGIE